MRLEDGAVSRGRQINTAEPSNGQLKLIHIPMVMGQQPSIHSMDNKKAIMYVCNYSFLLNCTLSCDGVVSWARQVQAKRP